MKRTFCCFLILLTEGCREIYNSPVAPTETGYLVVEGIINSGSGVTTIKLSRTTNLDNMHIQSVTGAQVRVERDDNAYFALIENNAGSYSVDDLNLDTTRKYRLNIRTSDGKGYLSDFTSVKNNPPIDSISWQRENNGVQLYVSTHDSKNNTRYYQWEYTETWEFHSAYPSSLKIFTREDSLDTYYWVGYRDSTTFAPVDSLYYCWQSESSSNLVIGSSARLSNDAIYLPLTYIPPESWKLSVLYSMYAKQYSLTKEGYEFLERMKKNTEGTGSVFDAQPSELNGNIHCVTNPTESVIGYVNICPISENRIFIKNEEVPGWAYDPGCIKYVIENTTETIKMSGGTGLEPTYVAHVSPFGGIETFYASTSACVDCRLRGSSVKPSFWP